MSLGLKIKFFPGEKKRLERKIWSPFFLPCFAGKQNFLKTQVHLMLFRCLLMEMIRFEENLRSMTEITIIKMFFCIKNGGQFDHFGSRGELPVPKN